MTAVVFSSSHPVNDPRVRRSVNALSKLGSVLVFLNEEYVLQSYDGFSQDDIQVVPMQVGFTRILKLKMPRYRKWARTIQQATEKIDVIYIHESGMVGLLLGSYLKKITGAKFIFDYHDSLAYEIYYQLNKLGLASRWIIKHYMNWIKKYIHAVDAVVGVSSGQLDQLTGHIEKAKPALVIPNIRPYFESDYNPTNGEPELLWIGNVKKVNNIEYMIRLYNSSTRVHKAKIFGSSDPEYINSLRRASSKSIEFMGKYDHDLEIQAKLNGKSICVLTDAPDPLQTNLNEICSPNKVFSAINIGIPLLVHVKLKNVCDMILKYRSGNVYSDEDEFHRRLDDIIENYEDYRKSVLALKKALRERDYDNELFLFLRRQTADLNKGIPTGPGLEDLVAGANGLPVVGEGIRMEKVV